MSTVGIWNLVIKDGEPKVVDVPTALSIRVTNMALGEEITDENGRTSVKLSFEKFVDTGDDDDEVEEDDEEEDKPPSVATTVLGALTPGKIEQASLDITLESDTMYEFQTVGKNTVHLTGNYFIAEPFPGDEESDFDDEDDEGHFLDELSSLADDDDASRFEEIDDDEPTIGAKRPRKSDPSEAEVSKSEKKKLKGEGGQAVVVEETKVEKKKEKKKDKKEKKAEESQKEVQEPAKKGDKESKSSPKTLTGGLIIEDAKTGSGVQAKPGSTVKMRYIGKLANGKIFDQNTKGSPFTFQLGRGNVIKGWDEGIVGMSAGGERKLTIPPAKGYGKKGQGKDIPPNSTLIFEVKCLEVK